MHRLGRKQLLAFGLWDKSATGDGTVMMTVDLSHSALAGSMILVLLLQIKQSF